MVEAARARGKGAHNSLPQSPLPRLSELRVDAAVEGWESRAIAVLALHGLVVVRGLISRELTADVLRQVKC